MGKYGNIRPRKGWKYTSPYVGLTPNHEQIVATFEKGNYVGHISYLTDRRAGVAFNAHVLNKDSGYNHSIGREFQDYGAYNPDRKGREVEQFEIAQGKIEKFIYRRL